MASDHARTDDPSSSAGSRPASAAGSLPKAVALLGLGMLAACTTAESQIETGGEMLPRPQVVIVDTFAASPEEVQLDQGVGPEIAQAVRAERGTSPDQQEVAAGQKVADAIADKLAVVIQNLGLKAQRGSAVPPGTEDALLIKGQLVSVDEGNRTERLIIGLGAGRSDVQVHAQVYEVTSAGRRLIDTIEVDARSGLFPGMAESLTAGALAGGLVTAALVSGGVHVADEELAANVVADADRAAAGIGMQLSSLFTQQGWTSRTGSAPPSGAVRAGRRRRRADASVRSSRGRCRPLRA